MKTATASFHPAFATFTLAALLAALPAAVSADARPAVARETTDDHDGHDHSGHDGHDHGSEHTVKPGAADDHAKYDHDDHDHGPEGASEPGMAGDHVGHDRGGHEDHSGHDHGDEEVHSDEVRLTAEAIAAYGIRTEPVKARALASSVHAPARIGFNEEAMAHVHATVTGRVSRISARLGDAVDDGDVLVEVQSPELGRMQADYLGARTAVAAAQPAVEIARDAYERAQQLYDTSGGVTLTTVREREAALKTAERDLILAESKVSAAANTLRLQGVTDAQIDTLAKTQRVDPVYRVRAPMAGQVIRRDVTPGELVGPDAGETGAMLMLADLSTVWLHVDVAEARLSHVGVGATAAFTIPAISDQSFEGEVVYVEPEVNPISRTVRLRVVVDNTNGRLRPGMFADVLLSPAQAAGAQLALPAGAVLTVEGEPSVFVPAPGEPNTFARRAVTVGPRAGEFVPVLSGLQIGEPVVVSGAFILKADLGKAGAKHEH